MSGNKLLLLAGLAMSIAVAVTGCPGASGPSNGWGYEIFSQNAGDRIVQRPDGGYFVSGIAWFDNESSQEIVLALDLSGHVEQQQIFPGVYSQSTPGPRATALLATDVAVYVAGLTAKDSGPDRYYGRLRIVKTDMTGNILWDNIYGDEHWVPRSIMECTDGCVAIGIEINRIGSLPEMILKLDSSGDVVWTSIIPDAYTKFLMHDAKAMPDGGFVVVGYDNSSDTDAALWRLDSDGNTLWYNRYDRPGWHDGWAVELAPDGGFYVGGRYTLPSGKDRAYLLKTDANGEFEWDKEDIYVPAEAGADVEVWDMVVDDEGYIAMVGDEETVEYLPGIPIPIIGNTSFVMRLAPDGTLQWKKDLGAFTYGIDYTQQGTYITTGFEFTSQRHYLRVVEVDKTGKVVN